MRALALLTANLALAGVLRAQSLQVFSEFRRIDPAGEVVAADRGGRPREVLSPAVARNAWASFHMVVTVAAGSRFTLHLGQNPENAVDARVYREVHEQSGDAWIPDRLEPVDLPYTGTTSAAPSGSAAAAVFWLDLRVAAGAPARRIKVEPQIWIDERWVIYPMEVRIMPAIVPPIAEPYGPLPALDAPADAAAHAPWRSYVCNAGQSGPAAAQPPTIRGFIRRNAMQDVALAQLMERAAGRSWMVARVLALAQASQAAAWCGSQAPPPAPPGQGPEWRLKLRDFLYRGY